jgi:dolichol-phosphate mannosyltransferase
MRFFAGLMNWMGFPATSVDVVHEERAQGKSTYTTRKLFDLAVNTIIAYSDKPLRLAIKLGFFVTLAAFTYGIYITYLAIFRSVPITGWSSLIVSLYFIGGIIIGTLGVMGIYLGKIFDQSKARPLYIINRRTDT